MAVMIALAWNANGTLAAQEKTPPKKTATKKKGAPARKSGVKSSSKKGTAKGHRHGVCTQAGDHHQERVVAWQKDSRQPRHVA